MPERRFEVCDQWAGRIPGLDTSTMEIVALLKWISWAIDSAMEPLYEGAPLTISELNLLLPLRFRTEPIIASRLAGAMKRSPAAISKTLARLEERGHVRRERNPANARAALVFITDAGKAAIDSLFPRQLVIESELLAGLGADRPRILEALHLLLDGIERRARPEPQEPG